MSVVISGLDLSRTPVDAAGGRTAWADASAREALRASGSPACPPRTVILAVAQTAPPQATAGSGDPEQDRFQQPDVAGVLAELADARRMSLSHACASGLFAVHLGAAMLQAQACDRVVVAGASAPTRYDVLGMQALGALSAQTARPFDRSRDGTSLGAGAGAVVLERDSAVRARAGTACAVVEGVDVRVVPEGRAASSADAIERCMLGALALAGRDSVDAVQAHATGTVQGDAQELRALESLTRRRTGSPMPVVSIKESTGHLLHAAGFASIASACGFLCDGSFDEVGPNEPEKTSERLVLAAPFPQGAHESILVNAFGFAGNYACALLARPPSDLLDPTNQSRANPAPGPIK